MASAIDQKENNGVVSEEKERLKLNEITDCPHGIKHGNPIYSELGFPVRMAEGQLMISTGEITDGFSKEFGDLVSAYSSYQLGWSAAVLSVCTAKYARIDISIRNRVRDLNLALLPVEEEFRAFLNGVVTRGKGAFGMKPFKRK